MRTIAAADPWQPYGKGKPHSPVPEYGWYGLLMAAFCYCLVQLIKSYRR
jgi:hypothetical protein